MTREQKRLSLPPPEHGGTKSLALDGKEHPKIISLGGDHTCVAHSRSSKFAGGLTPAFRPQDRAADSALARKGVWPSRSHPL